MTFRGGAMNNNYYVRGDVTYIVLKRKDGTSLKALIDTEDLPRAMEVPNSYNAHTRKNGTTYCTTSWREGGKRLTKYLHRLILDVPAGLCVDHINKNPLDNRKSNLRIITREQNSQNRKVNQNNKVSGVRGVSWNKKDSIYIVRVHTNGVRLYLGSTACLSEASQLARLARMLWLPFSNEYEG